MVLRDEKQRKLLLTAVDAVAQLPVSGTIDAVMDLADRLRELRADIEAAEIHQDAAQEMLDSR